MQSRRGRRAEAAKLIDNHGHGSITPACRRRRQIEAKANIFRYDADDDNAAWRLVNETQRGQQVRET